LLYGGLVRRGEKSGRVNHITKAAKKPFVSECKRLRHELKQLRRVPQFEDLIAVLDKNPDLFPRTFSSKPSLEGFHSFDQRTVNEFVAGMIGPTDFVNKWLAYSENVSPKYLQNRLSEIG
jgi:hypothetical protein